MKYKYRPTPTARFSSCTRFCLPEGEQLLGYPVPGRNNDTAVGRRGYNIVWYRPVDPPALAEMCTDADGRYHAGGIPPSIRKEVIARVKNEAKALLAPQIADIFLRSEPFFQPIFDLESTALVFGCVALAGDAALRRSPPCRRGRHQSRHRRGDPGRLPARIRRRS